MLPPAYLLVVHVLNVSLGTCGNSFPILLEIDCFEVVAENLLDDGNAAELELPCNGEGAIDFTTVLFYNLAMGAA